MNNILSNNGYFVEWNFPKIDLGKEYAKLKNFWLLSNLFYAFGKSKVTEWLLSFLYKYTHLEEDKMNLFLDNGNIDVIDDFMLPIIHSCLEGCTSYTLEDGTKISCLVGPLEKFNYKQRRDFLFLILKCKYNTEQANSILNYYSELTDLDRAILSKHLNAVGWKEIANKMEYDKDGKVESTFNFINDVILD